MDTLKFKTTINCSNCVARVTPILNKKEGIENWSVDTENPDKILTVETASLSSSDVINELKRIGFKAEEMSVGA